MKRWQGVGLGLGGLVVGAAGAVAVLVVVEDNDDDSTLSEAEYNRVVGVCESNLPDATLGDCVAMVDDLVADIELDGVDCDWRAVLSAVEAMTGPAMRATTDEFYYELVERDLAADGYAECFDTLESGFWP